MLRTNSGHAGTHRTTYSVRFEAEELWHDGRPV